MRLDLTARRALLLQGPVGPFFARFARELRARDIEVTKVNFNPGDTLFYREPSAIAYRGTLEDWPAFFRELVRSRDIDAVFLFGDCRPIHARVVPIARELGIAVWVFEEGYLRPHWVTLERDGVNGHSSLPKDAGFYREQATRIPELPAAEPVGHTFVYAALYATLYAIALTFFGWRYPGYRHHRPLNAFKQCGCWLRGFARKLWFRIRERGVLGRVARDWDGDYYFVPLQVHCDAQVGHSRFSSVEAFIEHVIAGFATHAPPHSRLVFKHHPQDRAYRDYGELIRSLGARHDCAHRVVYVHDVHLPTLLKHARGTITMNSTVGLSSLHHHTPVIALGEAIYDMPGLTFQGALSAFFSEPGEVCDHTYDAFCRYLRVTNQLNGSFYKRLTGARTASGLRFHAVNGDEDEERSWPRPIEESA